MRTKLKVAAIVAAATMAGGAAFAASAPRGKWDSLQMENAGVKICSMYHRLATDQAMVTVIWRDSDSAYLVMVSSPGLLSLPGDGSKQVPVVLGFDGKPVYSTMGDEVSPGRVIMVTGPAGRAFVDAIKADKELDVKVGQTNFFKFPLAGSAAVVGKFDACILKNGGSLTAPPAQVQAPAPEGSSHFTTGNWDGYV